MSISDWSSDVCTSDLEGRTRLGRGCSAGAKHGREAAAFADRCSPAAGDARPNGDPAGGRSDSRDALAIRAPRGARKSVVWGKRVSVRVALGGRRNIKKNQNENEFKIDIDNKE